MMVCDPLGLIKVSISYIYLGLNLSEMKIQKSSRYTFVISKVKLHDPLDTVKIHSLIVIRDPLDIVKISTPHIYLGTWPSAERSPDLLGMWPSQWGQGFNLLQFVTVRDPFSFAKVLTSFSLFNLSNGDISFRIILAPKFYFTSWTWTKLVFLSLLIF